MSAVEAVLFDLDDTLIQETAVVEEAFRAAAGVFAVWIDREGDGRQPEPRPDLRIETLAELPQQLAAPPFPAPRST